MSEIIETKELIETLESDLQARPKSAKYDFNADMMQKALDSAVEKLKKLEG